MHTVKAAFQKLKTILKFVWRHALTLINAYLGVCAFIEFHHISIKNGLILIIGAALLDWLKMKIKFTAGQNGSYDQMMAYARAEMDSSNFGSSAWMSNPMQPGSPANHLSSLGTSSKYY